MKTAAGIVETREGLDLLMETVEERCSVALQQGLLAPVFGPLYDRI